MYYYERDRKIITTLKEFTCQTECMRRSDSMLSIPCTCAYYFWVVREHLHNWCLLIIMCLCVCIWQCSQYLRICTNTAYLLWFVSVIPGTAQGQSSYHPTRRSFTSAWRASVFQVWVYIDQSSSHTFTSGWCLLRWKYYCRCYEIPYPCTQILPSWSTLGGHLVADMIVLRTLPHFLVLSIYC